MKIQHISVHMKTMDLGLIQPTIYEIKNILMLHIKVFIVILLG